MITLYIVVPCYNEEEVLPETGRRLTKKMQELCTKELISEESRIVFVDDGSKDRTWELIESMHGQNTYVNGIKLSRNKGHQNALMAGMMTVKGKADAIITLDADLQDDINAIDGFLQKFKEGCDVVYGVRSSRQTDTFFKRHTALFFYRLMKSLGVDIVYNHADYRLMSKRAVEALGKFKEVNLFLRGVVPLIGYRSGTVEYERHERFAGESKYPLQKMLAFAWEGITSFSVKPIRLIAAVGGIIFAISIIMLIYFLIVFAAGHTVPGWTSLIISIWAIGGLQILGTGIIGEYIGKIYLEAKGRPQYLVEDYLE
ncbi:MAG TPA: glycosyltransferase [Ruminococcaceae bacterium]|nr:glycosyltransferase [Oscillospiraceae bacterium]